MSEKDSRRLWVLSELLSDGHNIEVSVSRDCCCGSCWEYQIRDGDGDVYATGEGLTDAIDEAERKRVWPDDRYTLTDAGRAALSGAVKAGEE